MTNSADTAGVGDFAGFDQTKAAARRLLCPGGFSPIRMETSVDDSLLGWVQAMVIHAVYENGVFRPTEPVELPESCQVALVVREEPRVDSQASAAAPLARLAALAAAHPENPDLPTDLAEQHDHYLYGTPKR